MLSVFSAPGAHRQAGHSAYLGQGGGTGPLILVVSPRSDMHESNVRFPQVRVAE